MADDYAPKSIWNLDDARLRTLNYFMVLCDEAFSLWELNEIYSHLRSIRRIICAKINDVEFGKVTIAFKELEILKRTMNKGEKDYDKKVIEYYNKCDEIYISMSRLMKKHGLFFREGEDPTKAVLKR